MKHGYAAEDFKVRAGSRRNRNLNDKIKSGREKPLRPVKVNTKRGHIIEVDDDTIIDLKSIKRLSDIEME